MQLAKPLSTAVSFRFDLLHTWYASEVGLNVINGQWSGVKSAKQKENDDIDVTVDARQNF